MLRFEADRSAVGIGNAFLPDVSPILVITRIDLQAGLRREYLQHDPRSGRYQSGGRLSDVTSRVQHPVVVVTDAVLGDVKSNGEPFTAIGSPIGIASESIGVIESAAIHKVWSVIFVDGSPERLK